MTDQTWGVAPSLDDIAELAEEALERFAEPFRTTARSVVVRVEDYADDETLDALQIGDPLELTGLYSGVAQTLDSVSAPAQTPPIIWLYRMPILFEWAEHGEASLEDLVFHVLVHEVGHHFGWSDEEMDRATGADAAGADGADID